jgi:hypothetical protein
VDCYLAGRRFAARPHRQHSAACATNKHLATTFYCGDLARRICGRTGITRAGARPFMAVAAQSVVRFRAP